MHYAVNELIQETKTTYSLHSSTGMTNANCILVRTPHCTQNVGVSWAKEEANNMELTFEFYGTDVSSKNSYVAFTSTTSATAVAAIATTVTNAATSATDARELHVSFSETLLGQ